MSPLAVPEADLINGAKLLGWEGQIGALEPGYLADIVARAARSARGSRHAAKCFLRLKDGVIRKK
jgi:imidazolonepropionase-like amidohydrolase